MPKSPTPTTANKDYLHFLKNIKSRIQSARINAARSLSRELISLYWEIGKTIVEKQKTLGWGKSVVEQLSKDIQKEYNGISGFSSRNLWDMKRFYEKYSSEEFLRQLVAEMMNPKKTVFLEQSVPKKAEKDPSGFLLQLVREIPWGHNLLILNKIKDSKARLYYINASKENGWSRNVLLNQIKADAFQRHKQIEKQHNFPQVLPEHLAEQADETLKDSYMLDFLGITKPVLEREMEKRMVDKIRDVLIEFGHGFSFMGNQYRIKTDERDYFIDLMFYHRNLKCLIAVELKVGEFKPEYAGKMNFYLNLLDDYVREESENPSIGIILCAQRNKLEVEYSLKSINKPVGVAEYQLTKQLPPDLKDKLPSAEEIQKEILNEMGGEK